MEWIGIDATFVPEHYDPSTGFQDAGEFLAGFSEIEPVGGLRHSHEIDAAVGEGCGFGGSGDGGKAGKPARYCSPARRILSLGSTPKTRFPLVEEQSS